jgi:outer membrane receptor for ferrienterochelin and colicins
MTPGDIVMMLNEMGGLRVQATSPSLGAASVRVQGMRGHYTRFLSDGLPLFGEQVGSLGLLQIRRRDGRCRQPRVAAARKRGRA